MSIRKGRAGLERWNSDTVALRLGWLVLGFGWGGGLGGKGGGLKGGGGCSLIDWLTE